MNEIVSWQDQIKNLTDLTYSCSLWTETKELQKTNKLNLHSE